MPHPHRSGGFTLIEVALAIVIGVVIVAGATVLYNQTRTQTGNSTAKERAQSFSTLIEEYAANAGQYPDLTTANSIWMTRRPDDNSLNPWGGTVVTYASSSATFVIDGNDSLAPRTWMGDGDTAVPLLGKGVATVADRGRLYYFRCSSQGAVMFIDDFSTMDSSASVDQGRGYFVAYVGPNGQHWWMPASHALTAGVNPASVGGVIGP